MGIEAFIPIIAQYGIPVAMEIWRMVQSGAQLTQADWDRLNSLVEESPEKHLQSVASSAGVPMTDPRIQALAQLISERQ